MSKVRFFGAAHSGTAHAWAMRVSAAALLPLSLAFVWLVVTMVGRDYESVVALFSGGVAPGVIALLFVLTACYHMRKGMQMIIEDYVHDRHLKEWALIGNIMFCGLVAATAALAILKLSIG